MKSILLSPKPKLVKKGTPKSDVLFAMQMVREEIPGIGVQNVELSYVYKIVLKSIILCTIINEKTILYS